MKYNDCVVACLAEPMRASQGGHAKTPFLHSKTGRVNSATTLFNQLPFTI
ncbi:hypothetical protein KAW65_02780 [candidate division WOR-3 bacterium]|nr:hypothetical protein [candidate division WOR-3 bacterium]